MHRIRAAGIHLAICAPIATMLVLLVMTVWYPSPLFELAKGRDIFLVILGCDIVLGPLLTLVVFNIRKPKKELVRDLGAIAALQLIAMCYGIFTLLQVRPVYIVYNAGQFNVPLANEIVAATDSTAPDAGLSLPWFGPKLVGAKQPSSVEEHNRLLLSAVSGRGDMYEMPRYFVPYDDVRKEVVAHARTADQFAKALGIEPAVIAGATAAYTRKDLSFGLLPLVVRHTVALAVVDDKKGDLLGIVSLPPRN